MARGALSIAVTLIGLVAAAVLYVARVRFLELAAPGRIGHLAAEPDNFVKERALGLRGWCYAVILSPPGSAANDCLLDYWRRYIRVVRSPFWIRLLSLVHRFAFLRLYLGHYTVAIDQTAASMAVQRAWGNRPCLLTLEERHRREGRARLAEAGIPPDAEFVCFHVREAGFSPGDEDLHSFRNCNVENYLLAASELTKRGFWCIRMGDPSMRKLASADKLVDYAHLDMRSDWMDVFLCAECELFIGSPSGLSEVASVFGRPCAMANQATLSSVLKFGPNDVAMPMLLRLTKESRYLTFHEAFDSGIANFRFSNLYRERGVQPVENPPEDIRDLALEALERSQGRVSYSPQDEELQRRFRALMRPGHYSYGGVTRIGREFLRKYAHLLGDRPQ